MKRFLVTAWLLVVTLGLGGCGYNTLQSSDEQVKAAWAEVLHRARHFPGRGTDK